MTSQPDAKARLLERLADRADLTREERTTLLEAATLFRRAPSGEALIETKGSTDEHDAALNAEAILFSDGASRSNPGPAGIGVVLKRKDGSVIAEASQYLGCTTNNVAEYRALLVGLRQALDRGVRHLEARADSELIIKQLRGEYRIKDPKLKPLFNQAKRLLEQFASHRLVHVPREHNTEADRLANEAINAAIRAG